MSRYSRQSVLSQIGSEGQKKISAARVAIVGMGALGSVSAQLCARAGIGFLRLIDRDVVEFTNLQRQILFTEKDAREGLAKATAAHAHLCEVNSEIKIEAVVDDVNVENVDRWLDGIDLVLDGTDNFETRYLLNDFAVKNKISFVYGGVIETHGLVYAAVPDGRPCLRCLFPENPTGESMQTCDRTGVLASAAHMTASLQFTQALRILTGNLPEAALTRFDTWKNTLKTIPAVSLAETRCLGCREEIFSALEAQTATRVLKLCGRNAVQIQSSAGHGLRFENLRERWKGQAEVQIGADFARVLIPEYELTLFKGGRVIVKGTEDVATAKSVYARWIGC